MRVIMLNNSQSETREEGDIIHLPTFIAVLVIGFIAWAGFSTYEFYENKNIINTKLDSINTELKLSAVEYKKIEEELLVLGREYNELTRSNVPPIPPPLETPIIPNSLQTPHLLSSDKGKQ